MTETIAPYTVLFEQLERQPAPDTLAGIRRKAMADLRTLGIPSVREEEWKYTRIGSLFHKDLLPRPESRISRKDWDAVRLPGGEEGDELVFVNGRFDGQHSVIRSEDLVLLSFEDALEKGYREQLEQHLGHSGRYLRDGVNALNTALMDGGIFLYVPHGRRPERTLFIYHIVDNRSQPVLAQPRSLCILSSRSVCSIVETYHTLGGQDSLLNQVLEIVVEQDAHLSYYKIQEDRPGANQVSTTHIRQVGKSQVDAVTITLGGGMVRNNLNIVMEAGHSEANLYGLYLVTGESHVDNHTVVDNVATDCLSNELYKGVLDGKATGVFNGKILIQPHAQKTNAYQTNKNILLSETASVNAKPQLEIFADDVKCSHGCTVGQLDEDSLFYLRARGVPERQARALLLRGFAADVLEHIRIEALRKHVDRLITERLHVI